jgi:hypothetical protein
MIRTVLSIGRSVFIVFVDCSHGFVMGFRVYLHNVLLDFYEACGDDQFVMKTPVHCNSLADFTLLLQ